MLEDPAGYEPDTVIFVPSGVHQVEPTTPVQLLRHGTYSEPDIEGHRYFEQTGISARLGRVAREACEPALFDDEALRARYDEARRAATLRIRRPVVPAYDDPSAFRGVLDTLADAKAPLQALGTLELTSGDLTRLSAHWRGRLPLDARGKAVDLVVGAFDLRALLPEAVDHDEVRPLELPWVAAARARAEAEAEAAKAFQMARSRCRS